LLLGQGKQTAERLYEEFGGCIRLLQLPIANARSIVDQAMAGCNSQQVTGYVNEHICAPFARGISRCYVWRCVQLSKALKPNVGAAIPDCDALLRCVPSRDLEDLHCLAWLSPRIAERAVRTMFESNATEAIAFMQAVLVRAGHPARCLVESMLECLFRSALQSGALFRIRALSPEPLQLSGGQLPNDPQPRYVRLVQNQSALELKVSTHDGVLDDEEETAQIVPPSLFAGFDSDQYIWDITDLPAQPANRLLLPLQPHSAGVHAIIKADANQEEYMDSLFRFTVSPDPLVSSDGLADLLTVLSCPRARLFVVVPDRLLFDSLTFQSVQTPSSTSGRRTGMCSHDTMALCWPCAVDKTSLLQLFVLLCPLPGWELFDWSRLARHRCKVEPAEVVGPAAVQVQPAYSGVATSACTACVGIGAPAPMDVESTDVEAVARSAV